MCYGTRCHNHSITDQDTIDLHTIAAPKQHITSLFLGPNEPYAVLQTNIPQQKIADFVNSVETLYRLKISNEAEEIPALQWHSQEFFSGGLGFP